MKERPLIGYWGQFGLLLALLGAGLIVGASLSFGLIALVMDEPISEIRTAMTKPEYGKLTAITNVLTTGFAFLLPAFIFAKIVSKRAVNYVGFFKLMSIKQWIVVTLLAAAGLLLSASLADLNRRIPLPPDWMAQMKALELEYNNAIKSITQMKSVPEYLFVLSVLALAPAFIEEIFFRGCLQQVMIGLTNNMWIGIILTSLIFSAVHFSFFGFLPRAGLGLVLGFIFFVTKNIWLSVWMHFLNNGIAVTQIYILKLKGKPIPSAVDEVVPYGWTIVAAVVIAALFVHLHQESHRIGSHKLKSTLRTFGDFVA
jgi:membrane protease YdiL (CAAX protease family)